MRSRATHQPDEMVVIFGRDHVGAKVANGFAVDLGRSVEAKRHRDVFVLKIAVNSFGASNNLAFGFVGRKVLSQQASVCVGVVTADHNQAVKVHRGAVVKGILELLRRLDLVSSGTYTHKVRDIEHVGDEREDRALLIVLAFQSISAVSELASSQKIVRFG